LILAHGLSGGLERHAEMYLPLEPGTEDVLVHGVAAELLSRNPSAADPLRELPGFSEWASSTADYTPDLVASHTGVPAARFLAMASMIAEARKVVAVIVTGLGIPGDEGSVTRATAWLMSLLGGEEASPAVLVLGEKANVQGVIDVGLHSGLLPGHRAAGDEKARRELEELWGGQVPPGPGWSTNESFSHAARGDVGVLHIVGQDPVAGWPQCFHARQAIEGAAFVVLQDAFLTPTARLADVVLPVRILGDREGTLVGADGVRRILNRVRTPPLPLPQDGQIFIELARRLGADLPSGERVVRELERRVSRPSGKDSVRRFEAVSPPVRTPVPSGMLLDVSPQLFHSGLVTSRSRALQELAPTVAVRLGPADARELGVENGETIRVVAEGRELLLRTRLDRTVRAGTLVVPWRSGAGEGTAPLVEDLVNPVAVDVRRSK
jgi:predicted molibdopterin-dependent oxidoreductase YjgC